MMQSPVFVTAAFLAFTSIAFAQSSGSISGTVQDSHGGVIQAGAVTVSNRLGGVNQTARTNSEGNFVFTQLPPGTYTVTAEMAGFKKSEKKDVVLPAASRVNVGNMVLEVGALSETVTVAAEAGQLQIQSESGERSNLVTNRQLRDIGSGGPGNVVMRDIRRCQRLTLDARINENDLAASSLDPAP